MYNTSMKVFITDYQQENTALEEALFRTAGLDLIVGQCENADDVIEALDRAGARDIQAMIASYAPVTEQVLGALPQLKMISAAGVGTDHIDVAAARARGLWVANVPDANAEEVAVHALAMALSLLRGLGTFDRMVRDGHWDFHAAGPLRRPSGLTLGIVGLGQIGRLLGERATASFGGLLAFDPFLTAQEWPGSISQCALEDLFRRSDVISLHLPLTPKTHGLVNQGLLEKMKPGSYLVNVARGGLVDLDALLWALDQGILAGAGLDVLPTEPPPADHPILNRPDVLLSPHAAFYSEQSEEEGRRKAVDNIIQWARQGRPPYVVLEGR
ncbi:MAG: C-terminal binding protein [Pseudomonadota bacterium]